MADYGTLRIPVTADTSGLAKQIGSAATTAGDSAGKSLGTSIGKGVQGATGAIGKALGAVTRTTANVLGGATIAATGFGIAAFRTAARVGEMDATLRALSKGNAGVYDSMQKTVTAVRKSGIEAEVAQNLVAQFTRNQLDLGKATDLSTVAQNAAVIAGRNSTEVLDDLVHGITTQNSMVLRNAGINVQAGQAVEKYAKSVGKSTKELTDAERSQAVLNAVIEAGGPIAGAYAAAMQEPGKVLRSFPRVFDDIKLSVGKGLVDAFGPLILQSYDFAKALSTALAPGGSLAPILDAIGKAAGRLVEPLTQAVSKVTDFVKGMKPGDISGIASAIGKFAPQIAAVASALATFAGGNILKYIPVLGKLLGGLGGPFAAIAVGVGVLVATTPALRSAFMDIVKAAKPLLPMLLDLGKKVLASLMPAIQKLAPVLADAGKAIGEGLVDTLKTLVPAIAKAAGIFGTLIGALAPVIKIVSTLMKELLTGPLNVILLVVAAAFGVVALAIWAVNAAAAINPFTLIIIGIAALIAAISWAIKNFDTVKAAVASAFDAIKNAVMTAVNFVINFVKSNWPILLTIIAGPMGAIVAVIIKNWDTIKSAIRSAISAVTGVVSSGFNAVRSVVTSVVGAVVGAVTGAFSSVVGAIRSAMNTVTSTISSAFNTAKGVVSSGVGAISSAVGGIVGAISRALSGVVSAFTAPFRAAYDAVMGVIGSIKDAVSGVASTVSSGLAIAKAPYNAFANAWNGISISLPKIDIPLGPTLGGQTIRLPRIPSLASGGVVWPHDGGVLALLAEAGRPERVSPLGADGMTAGETATVALLRQIARLLAGGTSVEIDGREVAAATATATLFGVR